MNGRHNGHIRHLLTLAVSLFAIGAMWNCANALDLRWKGGATDLLQQDATLCTFDLPPEI